VKLIVGLGNPGRSYASTRHNVGWWMLDHLADVWRFSSWRKNLESEMSTGRVGGHDVRLVKPQTYMNLSGYALRPYLNDQRISVPADLLIIVDDVALPVGRYRLRERGSSGGHNGLESIEDAVGGRTYSRLRIGVGPPADRARSAVLSEDYVLDRMGKEERELVTAQFESLTGAVELWIDQGIARAMNRYNRRETGDGGRDQEGEPEAEEPKQPRPGDDGG
jgi:PTH1 family peptidyl-tRNA hydrolase